MPSVRTDATLCAFEIVQQNSDVDPQDLIRAIQRHSLEEDAEVHSVQVTVLGKLGRSVAPSVKL